MSYKTEVHIRPKNVVLASVAPLNLTSVVEIAINRPAEATTPLIGDGLEMPVGQASEGDASDLTVTITFNDMAQAQALIGKHGEVADLSFETRNVEGELPNDIEVPNCCGWGEADGSTFAKAPGTFAVTGSFFSDDDADPVDITQQTGA